MHTDRAALAATDFPNGTALILRDGEDWMVIVRDDATAKADDYGPDACWFLGYAPEYEAPQSLADWLASADEVHAIGEQIGAFR